MSKNVPIPIDWLEKCLLEIKNRYRENKSSDGKIFVILVGGERIKRVGGKSAWSGTGAAKNALRLILQDALRNVVNYYAIKGCVDIIMKTEVGLDESYTFHIKEI